MGGVFLRVTRECDRCPARCVVEVELRTRDGQLTADLDETPEDWKSVRQYGRYHFLCPACATKEKNQCE